MRWQNATRPDNLTAKLHLLGIRAALLVRLRDSWRQRQASVQYYQSATNTAKGTYLMVYATRRHRQGVQVWRRKTSQTARAFAKAVPRVDSLRHSIPITQQKVTSTSSSYPFHRSASSLTSFSFTTTLATTSATFFAA